MDIENWRDVKGYEGFYQVSNLGRVKSLDRVVKDINKDRTQLIKGKMLKPADNGNGYLIVSLRKDNKRKNHYIHRLVGEAFLNDYLSILTINHKDFNRKNNNVSNLEVCTIQENLKYSYEKNKKMTPEFISFLENENKNGKSKTKIMKEYHISWTTLKKSIPSLKNYGTKGMSFNCKKNTMY